ncbi:clumping factor B-like [Antennarius striatus]|uniref:clumping factor B-like n=1 Tax=Antennarius striatus TaxID=241820 RepID=UPI0035B1DA9F
MDFDLVLALVIVWSCVVAGQSPIYALKGQQIKLTADINGQPDQILWKHNGNKVVDFDGKQERVSLQFTDRITLDWHSAQLLITDLRLEDGGEYELEAFVNKKLQESLSRLEVIDKVPVPTITCHMDNNAIYNKSATLECSIEPRQKPVQIKWTSHGNVKSGPNLTINLGDLLDEEEYTCTVSNPLSNAMATFTAKACYPDKSSHVALITSLTIIGFGVLLGSVFGVLFCRRRRIACFEQHQDEERVSSGGADEKAVLLDRAPTLPSNQRLHPQRIPDAFNGLEDSEGKPESAAPPPSSPESGLLSDVDQKHDDNNKGAAASEQLRHSSDEACSNAPDAAADGREASASDAESFTAPKIPELEEEEEANKDDEANPPTANGVCPRAQPHSPLSQDSPSVLPKDSAGEPDKGSDSDQISGDVPTTFREFDSSGIRKTYEPGGDEQPSTTSEEKGSETLLDEQGSSVSQGEACSDEEKEQEEDSLGSSVENESDGVSHHEKCEEPDLYLANSQQPRSPTPENRNASTSQETADTSVTDSKEEEEAKTTNSDEVGEEGGERVENTTKSDSKEEKPGQ